MSPEKQESKIVEFFKNEYDRMLGFVRKLINDTADRDGEDIIQDVICNIFNIPDLDNIVNNLSGYIYRALKNRSIDLIRKRKNNVSLDSNRDEEKEMSLINLLQDNRYNASRQFEKNEMLKMLYSEMDKLPDEQKAIIIMTEFEGKTFKEISEMINVPIGTLLARKSRAINRIRKNLSEY